VSGIAHQDVAFREDVESGVVVVIDFHYGAEFGFDTVFGNGIILGEGYATINLEFVSRV
jgi:hypothetical protein